MDMYGLSDQQIEMLFGKRLRALRLKHNVRQEDLASNCLLGLTTIKRAEKGQFKVSTLIAILRELNELHLLEHFMEAPAISPLEEAKKETRQQIRVRGPARTTVKKSPAKVVATPASNDFKDGEAW